MNLSAAKASRYIYVYKFAKSIVIVKCWYEYVQFICS